MQVNFGPKYRTRALLAKGGMGAVYLGETTASDGTASPVAIKVMLTHTSENPENVAMFVDEARIGARINHPNVVRVIDADLIDDSFFVVMEYVEGVSLARLLRRCTEAGHAAPPIEVTVKIIGDILLGLGAAHDLKTPTGASARVIHRDVSPQNVLVGADGVSRLTDFGVASFLGRMTATEPGTLRGKLAYIAPEQLSKKGLDHRADVFAAGIVLWEALVGRSLFASDTPAETLANVLAAPIEPPSAIRPEISAALDDVCMRALERNADRRFPTAHAFAKALAATSKGVGGQRAVSTFVNRVADEDLTRQRDARDAETLPRLRSAIQDTEPSGNPAHPGDGAPRSETDEITLEDQVRPGPVGTEERASQVHRRVDIGELASSAKTFTRRDEPPVVPRTARGWGARLVVAGLLVAVGATTLLLRPWSNMANATATASSEPSRPSVAPVTPVAVVVTATATVSAPAPAPAPSTSSDEPATPDRAKVWRGPTPVIPQSPSPRRASDIPPTRLPAPARVPTASTPTPSPTGSTNADRPSPRAGDAQTTPRRFVPAGL